MFTSHLVLSGAYGGGGIVQTFGKEADALAGLGDIRLWMIMLLVPAVFLIARRVLNRRGKA